MRPLVLGLLLLLSTAPATNAQQATAEMGDCLVGSTTGRERIALVRWIAFSIAEHPEVSRSIAAPQESMQRTDTDIAFLFSDLLVNRCRTEAINAISIDGDSAIETAFEALGKVAMAEVMMNPEVLSRMMAFVDQVDEESIEQLFLDSSN